MKNKVAVLFIIFNRLETTKKVFDMIIKYKPSKLYVASDGARNSVPGENRTVDQVRSYVINHINWECDLKTLFREENVGCGRGPSDAISWFFEHEEMGIILEDDCVPSMPFFSYCEFLLPKYKNEHRIWIISGRCEYNKNHFFKNQDYLFSNYVVTWGWATWKRCWNKFDINIRNYWNEFYNTGGFKNVFFTKAEGRFRNLYYKHLLKDSKLEAHVWDYQFLLNMNQNGGLGVVPSKNLIENIGYEGTHFVGTLNIQKRKASQAYQITKEPKYILPIRQYEISYFYHDLRSRICTFLLNRYIKVKRYLTKKNR